MIILVAALMSIAALLLVAYPILVRARSPQRVETPAEEQLDELLGRRDAAFQALRIFDSTTRSERSPTRISSCSRPISNIRPPTRCARSTDGRPEPIAKLTARSSWQSRRGHAHSPAAGAVASAAIRQLPKISSVRCAAPICLRRACPLPRPWRPRRRVPGAAGRLRRRIVSAPGVAKPSRSRWGLSRHDARRLTQPPSTQPPGRQRPPSRSRE